MKYFLTTCLTILSLNTFAQTIDPGTMGSTVGVLNQVTDEEKQTDQQDQHEIDYQEEQKQEQEKRELQKDLEESRFDEPVEDH